MTDMDITFIFIKYVSVTIQRQANSFHSRTTKIFQHESTEFIDNHQIEVLLNDKDSYNSNYLFDDHDERMFYYNQLQTGIQNLEETEKFIIYEKFLNKRSDADIGKTLSVSGQMISKRKRKILEKLKKLLLI